MAIESAFRQRVAVVLRANGCFIQTVESDTTPGIPDLYYLKDSVSGWVELKLAKVLPKRSTTAVFKSMNHSLSNEQANWISLCLKAGGTAWVLAGYKRTLWLVPGALADQFNDMTVEQLDKFKVTKEELPGKLLAG